MDWQQLIYAALGLTGCGLMIASGSIAFSELSSPQDQELRTKLVSMTSLALLGAALLGAFLLLSYLPAVESPSTLLTVLTIAALCMSLAGMALTITNNRMRA